MRYARLGGAVAGAVALLGLLVAGAALLVGRAALDGTAETIWTVVGVMLLARCRCTAGHRRLLTSVGRQVRHPAGLRAAQLARRPAARHRPSSSKRPRSPSTATQAVVATAMPTMGRLRYQALQSGTAKRPPRRAGHADAGYRLLLAVAIVSMLFAAGAGFILFLIWVVLSVRCGGHAGGRAAGTAASRAAALLRHSRSSSSGIESATMPAPACTLARRRRRRTSCGWRSPCRGCRRSRGSRRRRRTGPRLIGSSSSMISIARTFGAPLTRCPPGSVARSTSIGAEPVGAARPTPAT